MIKDYGIRLALQIFMFDTANGYHGEKNEEMLGVNLKGRPRNSFIMATKVQHKTWITIC